MLNAFDVSTLKGKGEVGEQYVTEFLQKQNYTILERNYNCRQGEIDIIAKRDDIIAFVEVKTRIDRYFDLSEVITYGKQMRIIKATHNYISTHSHVWYDFTYRFDVALVELDNHEAPITYIEDAFGDTLKG